MAKTPKTPLLNKTMSAKVNFAKFAIDNKVDPFKLGVLCQLVIQRANFAVNMGNRQQDQASQEAADAKDDRLIDRIRDLALELGFTLSYHSLYPTLQDRNDKQLHLPIEG